MSVDDVAVGCKATPLAVRIRNSRGSVALDNSAVRIARATVRYTSVVAAER